MRIVCPILKHMSRLLIKIFRERTENLCVARSIPADTTQNQKVTCLKLVTFFVAGHLYVTVKLKLVCGMIN